LWLRRYRSESRVYRFALQRQDRKDALVHAAAAYDLALGLATDDAVRRFLQSKWEGLVN
jgi:predicted RNA polymerase sigma factor